MSRRLASSLALLATTALATPAALADPKYPATIDVLGQAGTDGAHGGLEMMVPLVQDAGSLFFADARGLAGDDQGTGSLGLGYRDQLWPSWILGGYGFLDIDRADSGENYLQGVLGAEALSETFDLRANGYLPQSHENSLSSSAARNVSSLAAIGDLVIVDHEIGLMTAITGGSGSSRTFERPLPGFDVEVGVRVPILDQDFRLFGGYYRFDAQDYDAVAGPRARAEWRIHDLTGLGPNSRLTFDAEIRHDGVRGTDASAGLRLRIPFGGVASSDDRATPLAGLDRRMLDPIHREDHPVIGHRTEVIPATTMTFGLEPVVADDTGNEITSIYFANGTGGGDGTQGNPTTLANAVSGAGTGGLIVALGGGRNLAGNVTLQANQILLGGASTLALHGISSGTPATYDPAGARPMIVGANSSPLVTLASGTLVRGIDFTTTSNGRSRDFGDVALLANGSGSTLRNLIIDDVSVNGSGDAGIAMFNVDNVGVTGIAVTGLDFGLLMQDTANAAVDGVTVSNAAVNGFRAFRVQNSSFANFTITGVPNTVAALGGFLQNSVLSNFIIDGGFDGLNLTNSTGVTVNGIEVDNMSARGVLVLSSTNMTLGTLTAHNSNTGLDVQNSAGVTVNDLSVTDFGPNPAVQVASSSKLQIDGFVISNALSGISPIGVAITGGDTVSLLNGQISDAGEVGVQAINASNLTLDSLAITAVRPFGNPGQASGVKLLDVGGTTTLNNVAINGLDTGGTPVTVVGFTFLTNAGTIMTLTGAGNTVTNTIAGTCTNSGLGTITGTIQVNGNPEPGTSC